MQIDPSELPTRDLYAWMIQLIVPRPIAWVSSLSSNGIANPATRVKLVWGLLQSTIAAVLLMSGVLQGLQTASIVAAAPFAIIMTLMCYSLYLSFNEELNTHKEAAGKPESV